MAKEKAQDNSAPGPYRKKWDRAIIFSPSKANDDKRL